MKARLQYPRCNRCGYQYDPKKSKKRVMEFRTGTGKYIACQDCITEYGAFLEEEHTEEEKKAFLDTLFVPDQEEVTS